MAAHTIRRRIWLISGSETLSTTAPGDLAAGVAGGFFATGAEGDGAAEPSLVGVVTSN
jgi:hypothetical protein